MIKILGSVYFAALIILLELVFVFAGLNKALIPCHILLIASTIVCLYKNGLNKASYILIHLGLLGILVCALLSEIRYLSYYQNLSLDIHQKYLISGSNGLSIAVTDVNILKNNYGNDLSYSCKLITNNNKSYNLSSNNPIHLQSYYIYLESIYIPRIIKSAELIYPKINAALKPVLLNSSYRSTNPYLIPLGNTELKQLIELGPSIDFKYLNTRYRFILRSLPKSNKTYRLIIDTKNHSVYYFKINSDIIKGYEMLSGNKLNYCYIGETPQVLDLLHLIEQSNNSFIKIIRLSPKHIKYIYKKLLNKILLAKTNYYELQPFLKPNSKLIPIDIHVIYEDIKPTVVLGIRYSPYGYIFIISIIIMALGLSLQIIRRKLDS